jgi:hypothetical protein
MLSYLAIDTLCLMGAFSGALNQYFEYACRPILRLTSNKFLHDLSTRSLFWGAD